MAGLQAGAKAVDGLVDIGVNSLNEALWGDYYRDKEGIVTGKQKHKVS